MSGAHSIVQTREVQIVDADGAAIRVGSVLERVEQDEQWPVRGVVTHIALPGVAVPFALIPPCVGDIFIQTGSGSTRVTNQWSRWRHIPRDRQTYWERLRAWLAIPFDHDEGSTVSRAEAVAIEGILALLPVDPVNWEYGPFPDRIEDALRFLQEHLSELSGERES